ncbi:MAG: PH domain-containing protein [Pseudohaliea sp.]
MSRVYRSRVDRWLVVVLVASAIVCLGAALASFRAASGLGLAGPLVALLVGIGLPLWLVASTRYTLTDEVLRVTCGPFRWRIPLGQITGVTPTSNPLSSPALSLDRLCIAYGSGKSVLISPEDKRGFIDDLEGRRAGG